jgi:DNA-binding response OmpR family regulator
MKKKILIIEDDNDLNSTISKFLTLKDFEVKSVYDGQSAVDKVYEEHFDIILLDIKLPFINGYDVAKNIREFSDVAIIFLTSLDSQKDIEQGFLSGGDDYITKPFSLNELLLRINAILRRTFENKEKIQITDEIYFDTIKSSLFKNQEPVKLTAKEIKLLQLFLKNKNSVLTRETIFNDIYDYEEKPNEASLRVFINKLRHLIGKDKIQTVKNIGYKYVS